MPERPGGKGGEVKGAEASSVSLYFSLFPLRMWVAVSCGGLSWLIIGERGRLRLPTRDFLSTDRGYFYEGNLL